MKAFLAYPPGAVFQRGEDRCQSNIKQSTATSMRACNDLGTMVAVLRLSRQNTGGGAGVFLRDYATEGASYEDFLSDIEAFIPDWLIMSTTNATVFDDIKIVQKVKADSGLKFKAVLKGAIFFNAPDGLLAQLDLTEIDVLVGGEIDWVIGDIVDGNKPLADIPGIIYKDGREWHRTAFNVWNENLDSVPFPARDLMKNELYTRPDTGEPMATIQTARGCPSQCIYCLSPAISGRKVRSRSAQNVFAELEECYNKYGIHNFFFRADTFTINREWVLELCALIKASPLQGKIHYTANSRVKPLTEDVLQAMKDTGCFTVAFGFESGSEETMRRIGKGATVEDNRRAMQIARKVGIPVYGFFMAGFPWEDRTHLKDTERLIFELDCDFIELHIALPYYGSAFYDLCKAEGVISGHEVGTDYFHSSSKGTKYLSSEELLEFRRHLLLRYHTRPRYILRKLRDAGANPRVLGNYMKYGMRLLSNLLHKA